VNLADGTVLRAKALVIATGVGRRKLNVDGETKFYGKGILESGQRDKNLVKNKRVLIVGGGDAALENAVLLAKTARQVYIVHRSNKFKARREFVDQLNGNPQISILFESVVTKFTGRETLTGAEIQNLQTGETKNLEIDAALIRIGVEPNTAFLNGKLKLDDQGYITINSLGETSLPRVFAIGDVANPMSPTISSATGMGSTAAKTIFALLNHKKSL
jgi:thioredoxin reductase (NADPH)